MCSLKPSNCPAHSRGPDIPANQLISTMPLWLFLPEPENLRTATFPGLHVYGTLSLRASSKFKNRSFSGVLFIAIYNEIFPTEGAKNLKRKKKKKLQ